MADVTVVNRETMPVDSAGAGAPRDADSPLFASGDPAGRGVDGAAPASNIGDRLLHRGEHREHLHGDDGDAPETCDVLDHGFVRHGHLRDPVEIAQPLLERPRPIHIQRHHRADEEKAIAHGRHDSGRCHQAGRRQAQARGSARSGHETVDVDRGSRRRHQSSRCQVEAHADNARAPCGGGMTAGASMIAYCARDAERPPQRCDLSSVRPRASGGTRGTFRRRRR